MAQVYITSNKPSENKKKKKGKMKYADCDKYCCSYYSHFKNTMYYVSISKKKKNTMYHHYRRYITFATETVFKLFAMVFFFFSYSNIFV